MCVLSRVQPGPVPALSPLCTIPSFFGLTTAYTLKTLPEACLALKLPTQSNSHFKPTMSQTSLSTFLPTLPPS